MTFLAAEYLAEQILTDGFRIKGLPCPPGDRDKPRQHQSRNPEHAGGWFELPEPSCRAIYDDQRKHRQTKEHDDQRSFEEYPARHGRPEQRRVEPQGGRSALLRKISACQT